MENTLNRTVTQRLPLGDVLRDQPPGIYTLSAARPDGDSDAAVATQWMALSDLGLTTMADAAPRNGVEIKLLSRANRVPGNATTGAQGHARLAPGLLRGTGGAAPQGAPIGIRTGLDHVVPEVGRASRCWDPTGANSPRPWPCAGL